MRELSIACSVCPETFFFFFGLLPGSQIRLPDMGSEEQKYYRHLNKFCLLWNVLYHFLLCLEMTTLGWTWKNLFSKYIIRRLLYARHSEYREPGSMGSRLSTHPNVAKSYPTFH